MICRLNPWFISLPCWSEVLRKPSALVSVLVRVSGRLSDSQFIPPLYPSVAACWVIMERLKMVEGETLTGNEVEDLKLINAPLPLPCGTAHCHF